MKSIFTAFILLIVATGFVFGQEVTAPDGKKIIFNADGTWKYAQPVPSVALNVPADCASYIQAHYDELRECKSYAPNKTTGFRASNGEMVFTISPSKTCKGEMWFLIRLAERKVCFDKDAKISFTFRDGSKLEFASNTVENCFSDINVYFGGSYAKMNELKDLQAKRIATIRLWTKNGYIEGSLSDENSEYFYNVLNCLEKQMPTSSLLSSAEQTAKSFSSATASTPATISLGDCSNYVQVNEDKMTGKKTTYGQIIVSDDGGDTGFSIILMNSSTGGLIIAITGAGSGSGCVSEGDKINILFRDGSRMELVNEGKFNCQGKATAYFGDVFGKKKQWEELKTKKIETLRVWSGSSYVQSDFTNENSEAFYGAINCLAK